MDMDDLTPDQLLAFEKFKREGRNAGYKRSSVQGHNLDENLYNTPGMPHLVGSHGQGTSHGVSAAMMEMMGLTGTDDGGDLDLEYNSVPQTFMSGNLRTGRGFPNKERWAGYVGSRRGRGSGWNRGSRPWMGIRNMGGLRKRKYPNQKQKEPIDEEQQAKKMSAEITVPKNMMLPDYCKLCDAKLAAGPDMAKAHYSGKRHEQKENQYIRKICMQMGIDADRYLHLKKGTPLPTQSAKAADPSKSAYTCFLCSVSFESMDEVQMHIHTTQHVSSVQDYQNRLKELDGSGTSVSRPIEALGGDKKMKGQTQQFYCNMCNKVMNSPQQYDMHIASKGHKRKEDQQTTTERLTAKAEGGGYYQEIGDTGIGVYL